MIANNHQPDIRFGGHETFAFRGGWLKKAVDATAKDPAIFSHPKAIAEFGVGRKMIDSIRHWALAMRCLESAVRGEVRPTEFGKMLLGAGDDGGRDPYLENPASIWMLHYRLATSPLAGVWVWLFGYSSLVTVSPDIAVREISRLHGILYERETSLITLRRDFECCVRCYVPQLGGQRDDISSFDCPLRELDLVQRTGDGIIIKRSRRPSLSGRVFLAALADFWRLEHGDAMAIPVEQCLYAPRSPGAIFRLSEDALAEYIMEAERLPQANFAWSESEGMRQIIRRQRTELDPDAMWRTVYDR